MVSGRLIFDSSARRGAARCEGVLDGAHLCGVVGYVKQSLGWRSASQHDLAFCGGNSLAELGFGQNAQGERIQRFVQNGNLLCAAGHMLTGPLEECVLCAAVFLLFFRGHLPEKFGRPFCENLRAQLPQRLNLAAGSIL